MSHNKNKNIKITDIFLHLNVYFTLISVEIIIVNNSYAATFETFGKETSCEYVLRIESYFKMTSSSILEITGNFRKKFLTKVL